MSRQRTPAPRPEFEAMVFAPNERHYAVEHFKPSAQDMEYMGLAMEQAEIGLELGNYPIGAVIANSKGDVWAAHADEHSANRLNGHAERNAIEKYNRQTGELLLKNVSMYTTFVPCIGCSHAIDQGELGALYIAATRQDVNSALDHNAVRDRRLNMPDVLHDSPRTLLVVTGLMRASSIELFKRRKEQKEAERQALTLERRKGF